jgi:hypothetical protein
MCLYVLSSVLICSLRFLHNNDVRFVFTSLFVGNLMSYLRYLWFFLRIVVSKTCCVVFLFCLSSSCVPYIASFSGLSFLIAPSVFSNVYLSVSLDCPF